MSVDDRCVTKIVINCWLLILIEYLLFKRLTLQFCVLDIAVKGILIFENKLYYDIYINTAALLEDSKTSSLNFH